ncbi:MAG: hypothetical protein QXI35_08540 [Candidatus Nezhaarchaeales archaeon]
MSRMKHLTLTTLGVLVLSVLLLASTSTTVEAQVTITTDKALYAIIWSDTSQGYVNITVTASGLDPTKTYAIEVSKLGGPPGLSFVREISGAASVVTNFTIPPTMNAGPADIAGTWNATIYVVEGGARTLITYINFGIWAINARELNYGRILQVWGGGASPGTKVNFKVYNRTDETDVTSLLFGESPAVCTVGAGGTFSNTSRTITTDLVKGTYVVNITYYTPITDSRPLETQLDFTLTDELLITIISPSSSSKWNRTCTIPIEVEVLYKDYTPVIAGTVYVNFTEPVCDGLGGVNKTIPLTYDPSTLTWKGAFKIEKVNVTGTWNVTALAKDTYGNYGCTQVNITVREAVLDVETVTEPPALVPRTSLAWWVINVTYRGDKSPAELDAAKCTVYVVNATTKAIVGSASLTKVGAGVYNVTWLVPATAELGSYMFYIPVNGLVDNVTTCNAPNKGPDSPIYSAAFTVGAVALKVDVKTDKPAYAPGETVKISAKVTYLDTGVIMSAGTVTAYIYNATGHLIATIPLTFDGVARTWNGTWSSVGYPAGRYDVVVRAVDLGGNMGEGATYFYIGVLVITPSKGTVPPIECTSFTNITKDMKEWLVTASIFTDPASGKSLGTIVVIEGSYMTPNSKVNVTVDWLAPLSGYSPTKILLAMNVPTDGEGRFRVEVVFPTTIMGIYNITVRDAKGVTLRGTFQVVPGMILTPDPVVGSALVKVIAAGLPNGSVAIGLLVDETDALLSIAYQAFGGYYGYWKSDSNGTLIANYSYYTAKPGFIMPVIEPGTYELKLILSGGQYRNATKDDFESVVKPVVAVDKMVVANAFKELAKVVSDVEELKSLLASTNAVIEEVREGVATIKTDVGEVKADVAALGEALASTNAVITDVKADVATIKTDVGVVKANVSALAGTLAALSSVVADVKSGVATIKTDVGLIKADVAALAAIKAKLDEVTGTASKAAETAGSLVIPVWAAVILSLIAAITSAIAMVRVSKKIAG